MLNQGGMESERVPPPLFVVEAYGFHPLPL